MTIKTFIIRLVQIVCTFALYVVGAMLLCRMDTLGYVTGIIDLLAGAVGTFLLVHVTYDDLT